MPVSFSGLDMSWLQDPANRLPPAPPRKRVRPASKRSHLAAPFFMSDISAFVSPVGDTPEVISSRPQLREHEKKHNCFQTGNDFPVGTIGTKNEAKRQAREDLANSYGIQSGWGEV